MLIADMNNCFYILHKYNIIGEQIVEYTWKKHYKSPSQNNDSTRTKVAYIDDWKTIDIL